MWNAITKKLWIIILVPLLAGVVAFFISSRNPAKYKSVAVVEASIPDTQAGAEPDRYYATLVATMKTEVITSMASYRLLLHDLEKDIAFRPPAIQYTSTTKDQIRAKLEKKLSSFQLLTDADATEQTIHKVITATDYNIEQWLRTKQLVIQRRPATNEIEVVSSTEDPFLSAFAANAISQEFIRYETGSTSKPVSSGPANDSINYYRDEVERLRKDLEQKNSEAREAGSQATSQSPADEIRFERAKANRISEYEMKIVEEEWELDNLRDQLAQMQRTEPATTTQSKKDVSGNAKIQTIRQKIDQLSRIYAEGGSKDRQLDSVITRLRQQLNDETARLQSTPQKNVTSGTDSNLNRNKEMLQTRINRHEESIAALRNDIRKLKNTSRATATSNTDISRLRRAQEEANTAYNLALAALKKAEAKNPAQATASRNNHHLVLKEKALPSAKPESTWTTTIVLSVVFGTLLITVLIVIFTRPAPPPVDDIFLRVNYANQRRMGKKKHPHEGDVSLSNR